VLEKRYIVELNSLKAQFDQNTPALKEKLVKLGLNPDEYLSETEELLTEQLKLEINARLNSFYEERGLLRPLEINYDLSDQSFSSQPSDSSGSDISNNSGNNVLPPVISLDEETVRNLTEDARAREANALEKRLFENSEKNSNE
jgi:hypothetical protein